MSTTRKILNEMGSKFCIRSDGGKYATYDMRGGPKLTDNHNFAYTWPTEEAAQQQLPLYQRALGANLSVQPYIVEMRRGEVDDQEELIQGVASGKYEIGAAHHGVRVPTRPQRRFNPGDAVWVTRQNKHYQGKVEDFDTQTGEYFVSYQRRDPASGRILTHNVVVTADLLAPVPAYDPHT